MKKLFFYALLAAALIGGGATADAKSKHHHRGHRDRDRHDHHDHHDHYRRTRTIYVIERNRPVRRTVYVHPSGYYYRLSSGRPVRIRERYFTSYPSRYFYPDGRRRIGVTLSF